MEGVLFYSKWSLLKSLHLQHLKLIAESKKKSIFNNVLLCALQIFAIWYIPFFIERVKIWANILISMKIFLHRRFRTTFSFPHATSIPGARNKNKHKQVFCKTTPFFLTNLKIFRKKVANTDIIKLDFVTFSTVNLSSCPLHQCTSQFNCIWLCNWSLRSNSIIHFFFFHFHVPHICNPRHLGYYLKSL